MPRYWLAVVLAAISCLLSACELRMATEIALDRDGSGTLVVSVALDEESAADLTAAGLVPTEGLVQAAERAPGWRVSAIEGLTAAVRLEHDFEEPSEVESLLRTLTSRLGVEDGTAWDGLAVERQPDGTIALHGRAGIVAPTVAGAEGSAVTFDGDDLADLLDERGRQAVRHDLQVVWRGQVSASDADRVDDDALVWELPTGTLRTVSAALVPTPGPPTLLLAGAAALVAVTVALVTIMLRRRRATPASSLAIPGSRR